jgi:glutamate formiminotransferase / 5-formyltetrahydrofolate cyclo-ligase
VDAAHQVVWQVRGPILRLLGDVACLPPEGAARAEHVDARGRRRDDEPARTNPTVPIATPLRGIRHICEAFRQIDESLGERIDVSHPKTPSSLKLQPSFESFPYGKPFKTPTAGAPRVTRVPLPLESVPNFSEGREQSTLDALASALRERAELLDVHADIDHNRSVFTLVGQESDLVDALLAGVACATERIDLRCHEGAHPRVGAADVVPVVPISPDDMPRARDTAQELAQRIGDDLGLPVFLYGELAAGRGPAFFRRGGPEELQRRVEAGDLRPDFGPERLHDSAGAVLVGARRPLIAFNVNLRGELEAAREVAATVRESGGGGGFPGVRALGLDLPSAGLVQVSMNVEDWEAAALHDIVARVEQEALLRAATVVGSELVGLMPAGAAAAAAGAMLRIDGFDSSRVLELRLLER